MAERYKLPEEWGSAEIEGFPTDDGLWVDVVVGPVASTLPRVLLTPVKPPTPPEPEPGAWLIGTTMVVRVGVGDKKLFNPEQRWVIGGPVPRTGWFTFDEVWKLLGGPDVTITRLVPERVETVTLPWEGHSQTGHFILGVTPCRPNGREAANISIGDALATVTPPVAREMAAVLLAFANGAGAES